MCALPSPPSLSISRRRCRHERHSCPDSDRIHTPTGGGNSKRPSAAVLHIPVGRIVPAIDMRQRLGFPEAPSPISPTNIVLVVGGEFFSLLVDALVDVIDIPLASIEPPVAGAEQAGLDCLEGVHAAGDGLVHLLRAEAIIGGLTAPDLERKKR